MGVSTLRPLRAILLKIGMFFPPEAFTLGVPRLMEVERSSVAPLRKRDIDEDVGKKCKSIFFIIVHENDHKMRVLRVRFLTRFLRVPLPPRPTLLFNLLNNPGFPGVVSGVTFFTVHERLGGTSFS